MAEKDPFQFPWASMAVVATLVSSTLLVPRAFDLLRPAEKDRAQALVSAELEVEARLWEDPFVATRRYELERQQRCEKEAARLPRSRDCLDTVLTERRSAARLRERLDFDHDNDIEDTLLLAVMVPGNAFVGAEEARRRTRYGVLAGLQAEGYLPDNAEHIGLLQLDIPPLRSAAVVDAPDRLVMPYELLSPRRDRVGRVSDDPDPAAGSASAPPLASPREPRASATAGPSRKRYPSIALLWIDESALPAPKLDGLAYVLNTVAGTCTRCPPVALIGPSSSDGLRTALSWLDSRAARARLAHVKTEGKTDGKADGKDAAPLPKTAVEVAVAAGYRLLSNAALFNSSATISDKDLGELHGRTLTDFVRRRMARVLGTEAVGPQSPQLTFERTIASDDVVLQALADELKLRLPADGSRRVVLVTESDSIYSRTLERRLSRLIKPLRNGVSTNEDHVYFFRGVDGVTLRDGVERTAPSKADTSAAVEWPESRDQLDYLRRMAQALKRSESLQVTAGAEPVGGTGPIGAIGIFANDVHDKLLILQALHDSFPDKVFFTTDMDARFLHPRTLPFTRNLVVASSLPLRFAPQTPVAASAAVSGAAGAVKSGPARSLQTGTPPFRDVYQAATYLAARLAACKSPCDDIRKQAQAVIARPTVYEIGRDHAVPLSGFSASPLVPQEPSTTYQVGLATFLGLMAMGLLMWPSTPAMRRARDAVIGAGSAAGERRGGYSRLAAAFAMVYAGLFACAAGSVVEALRPGSLGPWGVAAWGGLAMLASLVLYPGARFFGASGSWRRGSVWRPAVGGGLLLVAIWLAWYVFDPAQQAADGEPLAWLQGISGWPSQLLNLLALVCGVATLDRLWSGIAEARQADEDWLGLTGLARTDVGFGAAAPGLSRGAPQWRSAVHWLGQRTLLGWRRPETEGTGKAVQFAELWRGYQQRGAALPRAMRVAFWTLVAACGAGLLFWAFSDHELPEVPVRGVGHRDLIRGTYVATLLLLPLVVVAVADATMLAWRFLRMLGTERTLYAPATVRRFATALGSVQVDVWTRTLAAEPAERSAGDGLAGIGTGAGAEARTAGHTLLDDWIDIQVVARRTRAVAPLVVAPFLMLALMVVARSRLFDNWSLSWPIATAAALYVLWLGLLALLLKQAAESCRERALARMNADLRWMAGADDARKALVEPMKRLIAAVEAERSGAFAPPFDQPFFKGLLVPLGGAGGAQLFERLLLAN